MSLSSNPRGALFMAVAMAGFTMNDGITKGVMDAISPAQVMLIRGLFATALIAALAVYSGALKFPRHALHPMVALRAACEFFATVTFLGALAHMPLANVSAVLQALPLAVTMGAALFLGETVGWRRWGAIIVGFLGVMVIVRPGFDGFNAYSVLVLVCVMFCAVRDLATRQLPPEVPSMMVSIVTAITVTIGGVVLVPFTGGWTPIAASDVAWLGGAAVLLVVGYQSIIMSMREGEISFIAPFRYTALLWAILIGFVFFGDVPDMAMIAGATIVVGSGLYALYRERILGRGKPAAESTSSSMAPDGV